MAARGSLSFWTAFQHCEQEHVNNDFIFLEPTLEPGISECDELEEFIELKAVNVLK